MQDGQQDSKVVLEKNPFEASSGEPNPVVESVQNVVAQSSTTTSADPLIADISIAKPNDLPSIVQPSPIVELDNETGSDKVKNTPLQSVEWSALESPEVERSSRWHIAGVVVVVGLIGVALLAQIFLGLWQIWTTVALAIIAYVALIIIGRKPPRTVNYKLDNDGITIDNGQVIPLEFFRAFGVSNDGKIWTLSLVPQKRLSMATTIIIPEEKGEAIVDMLGGHLPMENVTPDIADRLSRKFNL